MTAIASDRVLASDYEEVRACRGPRSGLLMAIAVHRTVDGRSLGGLRFEPYDTPDDAVADVKRLARAMTAKAAVTGLRLGGAKGVIAHPPSSPPDPELRELALHDFAELVDSFDGRYITAQDAGTSIDDILTVGRFTDRIAGHPIYEGGCGDPSPYTAHGIEVAPEVRALVPAATTGASSLSNASIIFVVTPEEALVLKWLRDAAVFYKESSVEMVLRSPTDDQQADTSLVVNLNYMQQKYNLAPPPVTAPRASASQPSQ